MTKVFWTPEAKQEYLKLVEKRENDRQYHRQYMQEARTSGKYKYYRNDENKVVYQKLDEADEKIRKR